MLKLQTQDQEFISAASSHMQFFPQVKQPPVSATFAHRQAKRTLRDAGALPRQQEISDNFLTLC